MAISQLTINSYKTGKTNYWTNANSVAIGIGTGDVIAYKNRKDGMFYAVKVISKTTENEDITLVVKGVRFKFEGLQTVSGVNYANIQVGDIFWGANSAGGYSSVYPANSGICNSGKPSDMGLGVSGTPSACISYAEFFDHETLTITGLLHAITAQTADDIEQITVLPDIPSTAPGTPGYATGTEAINKYTPPTDGGEAVLNGIARQLAYNFIYSVI